MEDQTPTPAPTPVNNPWRIIIAVLGIAFTALLIWGSIRGDFLAEGAALVTMPWGRVSLADLYLGFVLYALAVWVIEPTLKGRLFWALPVFILGNVWSALWVVVRWKVILARLGKG